MHGFADGIDMDQAPMQLALDNPFANDEQKMKQVRRHCSPFFLFFSSRHRFESTTAAAWPQPPRTPMVQPKHMGPRVVAAAAVAAA